MTLPCVFCASPLTAIFTIFSCMTCSGELPLTYVRSCHIAAISSRFCCQAQCVEPEVFCAVAANQSIAGSWRRCQSQPTVQGCSSSAGELECYNASCIVVSIVPYNQKPCLLSHRWLFVTCSAWHVLYSLLIRAVAQCSWAALFA